jgi:FkbM family methyltransferase
MREEAQTAIVLEARTVFITKNRRSLQSTGISQLSNTTGYAALTTINTIYGPFVQRCKRRLDFTYYYEHPQIRSLYRIVDLIQATRFFDVGANIGIYSVYLSSLETLGRIDAFEPAQDSLELLRMNQDLQDNQKINVHPLALSDTEETAEFAIYGELSGNNALLETTAKSSEPTRIERVTCRKLDTLAGERDETFVCKIDVEGNELKTIEGGRDYLRGNQGVLQVECFEHGREPLVEALDRLGYQFLFRLRDDLYFSNLTDPAPLTGIREILYSEVADALDELKSFKVGRWRLNQDIRKALREAGQVGDPVLL